MSKIVSEYKRLKEINNSKLYLFKIGKFYVFIGDDADTINYYMVLKKTKFSKEFYKCGFPEERLNEYLKVFKNLNLDIEIIKETSVSSLKSKLLYTDLNKLKKKEAIDLLSEIKKYFEMTN